MQHHIIPPVLSEVISDKSSTDLLRLLHLHNDASVMSLCAGRSDAN